MNLTRKAALLARQRKQTPEVVTLEGDEARVTLPEGDVHSVKISEFVEMFSPRSSDSGGVVLPDGVKCLADFPGGAIAVHETPPRVYNFRWIAADSKAEFGAGTSYRQVRLALPYLVVLSVFEQTPRWGLQLGNRNECFFVNQPLDVADIETRLCYPALLNCSRFPDDGKHPLSWICTQHLRRSTPKDVVSESTVLRTGVRSLLHHLLETGFNRSSEHHELSSWYTESVAAGIDPRIASVEAWESASAQDRLFPLEVPWLPTGFSLGQVLQRIRDTAGQRRRTPSTSRDVARVMVNTIARNRRARA